MTIEHMTMALGELKLGGAQGATDGDMTFSGYGAYFGNVDSWGDVIVKGAFAATIKQAKSSGNWPVMLAQHGLDSTTPIGVWTDMKEDDKGLWVEGKIANTSRGQEVYTLLKMTPRPAISGLSIGYVAKDYSLHTRTKSEEPRRTLKAVDLMEVSLVTTPANDKARIVNVKSNFNPREIEDSLREAGISRADSVKAVAVFKTMLQRDAGEPETTPRDEVDAADLRSMADRIRALSTGA